jgi:hypothetical protein
VRGFIFKAPGKVVDAVIASEAKQSSFFETAQEKESWIASSLRSSQ